MVRRRGLAGHSGREIWFSEGWATYIENAYDPGPPAEEDTANLQDFFDDIYSDAGRRARQRVEDAAG